jgi:hypothetical protein
MKVMTLQIRPGDLALLLALAAAYGCRSAASPAGGTPNDASQDRTVRLVAEIRRADYEADRSALARLHGELAADPGGGPLAARVLYWRGFAMWRRALNGFNDNAGKPELMEDLKAGIADFEASLRSDPNFTDAKIALASCSVNLSFLSSGPERMAGYRRQWDLLGEAQKESPDNPRLAWVLGAAQFYAPPPQGGQEKAIQTYTAGLESARRERAAGPLDPTWGEPELLMNLAFANLNRKEPDLDAADRFAREALAKVPSWHYVRDVLIPQIAEARKKSGG